jgi:riboflavin kinase/FMN adenylyltransferase
MRVAHDLTQAQTAAPSYVTVGVFDGVHRGHQQLITRMVDAAHSTRSAAVAVTFDPHPAKALGGESPRLLTTLEERVDLLGALGLDGLVVLPFTQATARTTATDFVDTLNHHLHLAQLWGGPDFSLGYRCEGDISFLRRLGARRGFTVRVVEPLVWEGALVNSSRVRSALEAGDIRQATGCLGRPYRLSGVAVHGPGPTGRNGVGLANICPPPERLIPASGAYACLARSEHSGTHGAVTYISARPAPGGESREHRQTIEVRLLDFEAELYGQAVMLDFIARLRDKRGFPTPAPDARGEQIRDDVAQARAILGGSGAGGGHTV